MARMAPAMHTPNRHRHLILSKTQLFDPSLANHNIRLIKRAMKLSLSLFLCMGVHSGAGAWDLDIFHWNDAHAHFEGLTESGGPCRSLHPPISPFVSSPVPWQSGGCGAKRVPWGPRPPRRRPAPTAVPPWPPWQGGGLRRGQRSLTLVAGDEFQGTIWYSVHKWAPIALGLKELQVH